MSKVDKVHSPIGADGGSDVDVFEVQMNDATGVNRK